MRLIPRLVPSDRRANRLLSLSQKGDSFGPVEVSGLEALALVVSVYGPDRLTGRGHRRVSDRALRDAVRRLVAEAREQDPERAERLIVSLRRAWTHHPAIVRFGGHEANRALWDRVVRTCCEEFYAAPEAVPASRPISVA